MVIENGQNKILEYLKKHGQTNTFRIARDLGLDRDKILDIVKILEEKKLIEFKSNTAKFLKSPPKERKAAKRLIKVKKALPKPKKKRKYARRRLIVMKKLQAKEGKLKEQAECIENLEKTIKRLRKKAKAPPRIIRKTIIKKVLVKARKKKIKAKLRKFNIKWMKNIKKLQMPRFIKHKIKIGKPKINFAKLNRGIKQLHVPEILKS